MNALVDLEIADIHLDRRGNRTGLASDRQAVDEVLEDAAGRDSGRRAPQLERNLGLDHLLGADPTEVEVQDLLAEVIPLHVADQDGLGRAADVEVGEMTGCLDHAPDVVPPQGDGNDRLLVTVDHGGNPPRLSQPASDAAAGSLVLRRVARFDPNFRRFRHYRLALTGPASRPEDRKNTTLNKNENAVSGTAGSHYYESCRRFVQVPAGESKIARHAKPAASILKNGARASSCLTASNTPTATALARFRLRASGTDRNPQSPLSLFSQPVLGQAATLGTEDQCVAGPITVHRYRPDSPWC